MSSKDVSKLCPVRRVLWTTARYLNISITYLNVSLAERFREHRGLSGCHQGTGWPVGLPGWQIWSSLILNSTEARITRPEREPQLNVTTAASPPPPSPLLSYVDIATANILYSHSQSILIRIIQTFIFYKIFAAQKLYIFIHALLVHVDKETLCRYTVELIWSSSSKSLNEAFIWVSSEQIKKRMQILSNIKERLDSFLLTQTSFCSKLSNETFICDKRHSTKS